MSIMREMNVTGVQYSANSVVCVKLARKAQAMPLNVRPSWIKGFCQIYTWSSMLRKELKQVRLQAQTVSKVSRAMARRCLRSMRIYLIGDRSLLLLPSVGNGFKPFPTFLTGVCPQLSIIKFNRHASP